MEWSGPRRRSTTGTGKTCRLNIDGGGGGGGGGNESGELPERVATGKHATNFVAQYAPNDHWEVESAREFNSSELTLTREETPPFRPIRRTLVPFAWRCRISILWSGVLACTRNECIRLRNDKNAGVRSCGNHTTPSPRLLQHRSINSVSSNAVISCI